MKYELGFYLNPHGSSRQQVMQSLANAGIKYVGIDGCGWDPDIERQAIETFRNELNEYGLQLHSMHACCSILTVPDKDTPPDLLEEQLKEIRRGALFGAKIAVYHACCMRDVDLMEMDRVLKLVSWSSFVDRNAKTIKILAKESAKHGISIVLENIPYSIHSSSLAGFSDIVYAVNEPNVGFLLDSGHAHIAGNNIMDEILFAGSLLMDTHFHDNAGSVTGSLSDDQHIPPGLGTIDWQAAIRALNEINYNKPIFFEGVLDSKQRHFSGNLNYDDLINITINNWRALEVLALRK